ncbi:hypothetical protein IWQ61_010480 [Dispira simplex]|nr:hypothetical protein IWQ61_010480 [Dispira simplex]
MLESAEATKIYNGWESLEFSSDIGKKLEEFEKSATDYVELVEKQSPDNMEKVKNLWDDYNKKEEDLLSTFLDERRKGSLLIDLINVAITKINNNFCLNMKDKWNEPLKDVRDALEVLQANYKAGPIKWVPFDPNDPVRSFLMFSIFPFCRAVSLDRFGNIFNQVMTVAKSNRKVGVIGKDFNFRLGATVLYTLTLEVAIREGSKAANYFFRRIIPGFRNAWEHSPTGCNDKPHTPEFLETNLLKKLDQKSKELFPLNICGVKYAQCEFNPETQKHKCQLPMTNKDYENREAWAQRLVQFQEQKGQESRLTIR